MKIEKLEHATIGLNYGSGGASFDEMIDKVNEVIDALNTLLLPSELTLMAPPESEDERIRKALVWHIEHIPTLSEERRKEVLAWLEKQKEQKPAEWSKDDAIRIEDLINLVEHHHDKEYDWFDYKDLSSWLKDLPNRFELQPKQEWSEEDEKMIKSLVDNFTHYAFTPDGTDARDIIPWLKAIRPHWKPSEEQMEALDTAIKTFEQNDFYAGALVSLLFDLKKL